MSRRMLLTLIAILTGLSWQGSAVQARAMPATTQVSAISALATVQQARVSAVLARPATRVSQILPMAAVDAPDDMRVVASAGVRLRIDRARE
ncbi:MAG: hypothetical protein KDE25_10685 [Novosphingobium sp.]|nr:hypothetical protein [Novosphingobium sp.]